MLVRGSRSTFTSRYRRILQRLEVDEVLDTRMMRGRWWEGIRDRLVEH